MSIAIYRTKDKYKTFVKMQNIEALRHFTMSKSILKAHEDQVAVRRTNLSMLLTSEYSLLSSRIAHVVASLSFSVL